MRSKRLHIFCLSVFCLFVAGVAVAELSVTSQWRIEQAKHRCDTTENAIVYTEYWQDSVTDENRETVCMAEQFAKIAAEEGDEWLKNASVEFIEKCKGVNEKDNAKYYSCLRIGLEKISKQLSSSCKELEDEGLWDAARCERLVSYIFIKEFNKVLMDHRSIVEKAMENEILKFLFGPIPAIIMLLLYVIDIVLITDPGNWWRIPKLGLIVGTIILVSWFLPDQWKFLCLSFAILICIVGILGNHVAGLFKSDKEKKRR